jgi:hypothetical protein
VKITITGNDHSVDVEVADDTPDLDINEIIAMSRDLFHETRKPKHVVGFERAADG